jgi:hypothetical protein
MRARRTIAAAFLAAGAFACASPTPDALFDARASFDDARIDPDVSQYASVQLYEAQQAIERAESEWTAGQDVT